MEPDVHKYCAVHAVFPAVPIASALETRGSLPAGQISLARKISREIFRHKLVSGRDAGLAEEYAEVNIQLPGSYIKAFAVVLLVCGLLISN